VRESFYSAEDNEGWANDVPPPSAGRRGKRDGSKRRNKNIIGDVEGERGWRRRRRFLVAVSFIPFLFASVALAAMLATRSGPEKYEEHAASVVVAETWIENDAPTFAPSAATPTYAPSTTTEQPSHHLTLAPIYPHAAGGASVEPAVSGVESTSLEYLVEELPTLSPIKMPTRLPDKLPTKVPTFQPSTSPSTTPPGAEQDYASVCVAAGSSCRKDKNECCSGKCERDKGTGDDVCGEKVEGKGQPDEQIGAVLCTPAGLACPDKKKDGGSCCSGLCSAGTGNVCL